MKTKDQVQRRSLLDDVDDQHAELRSARHVDQRGAPAHCACPLELIQDLSECCLSLCLSVCPRKTFAVRLREQQPISVQTRSVNVHPSAIYRLTSILVEVTVSSFPLSINMFNVSLNMLKAIVKQH